MARIAVPLIDHRLNPEQIAQRLDTARTACDARLAAVVALPDAQRTFANTVAELEDATVTFADAAGRLDVLANIHTEATVRDAAAMAQMQAGQYLVEVSARRDIYGAVKGWLDGAGRTEKLDHAQQRLLEIMLRDFRRAGLELPDDKLARLVEIRTRLAMLSTQFLQHLNENTDAIEVTEAELDGVPASLVARLKTTPSGGRIVTTKTPDYVPFMENATSRGARRRLSVAYNSREITRNLPILEEATKLRDEAAKLLGHASHADFVTEDRMARTSERVKSFLEQLATGLTPRRAKDLERMTAIARDLTGDTKFQLESWDVAWALNQLRKRDLSIDTEEIRQYFPAETVVAGMFGVYETLLSVRIREVAGADVWHESVKLYAIDDAATGETFAQFYADLYPRDGKYGHAAVSPVGIPRASTSGYLAPLSVLLANFDPPAEGRPSLLSHDEVRTLFHEFGHVVHQSLTTVRFGSQAGFNVAGDFVEAPSQMLENWVFEPAVLDRMSGHWQDPSRKLPRETIARLRDARFFDAGWKYMRQLFFATFDQALHGPGGAHDVRATEHAFYARMLGLQPAQETCFAASFGHLLGGYDAGYYGYLWAEVFAADMFTAFEKAGVLDAKTGRRYRDTILAKGRSVEAMELLEQFLGRAPNDTAFLQQLGVG